MWHIPEGFDEIFILDLELISSNGKEIASNQYIFSADDKTPFAKLKKDISASTKITPALSHTTEDSYRLTIKNEGDAYALFTEVDIVNDDKYYAYYSANYFLLEPNGKRNIDVEVVKLNEDESKAPIFAVKGWNVGEVIIE